jgi:hypothetical protein
MLMSWYVVSEVHFACHNLKLVLHLEVSSVRQSQRSSRLLTWQCIRAWKAACCPAALHAAVVPQQFQDL